MKAGMFLAGLGSGVAQGYMLGKAAKKMDAKAPGELAPVRDANPATKVESAAPTPAATPAVDAAPATDAASTAQTTADAASGDAPGSDGGLTKPKKKQPEAINSSQFIATPESQATDLAKYADASKEFMKG